MEICQCSGVGRWGGPVNHTCLPTILAKWTGIIIHSPGEFWGCPGHPGHSYSYGIQTLGHTVGGFQSPPSLDDAACVTNYCFCPRSSGHSDPESEAALRAPAAAQEGQVLPAEAHPVGAEEAAADARAEGVQTQFLPPSADRPQAEASSSHHIPVQEPRGQGQRKREVQEEICK